MCRQKWQISCFFGTAAQNYSGSHYNKYGCSITGFILPPDCIFIYGFRYLGDELFAFLHTGRSIRDKDCNGIMAAIRQQHHSDIIDSHDPVISVYISRSRLVGDLRHLAGNMSRYPVLPCPAVRHQLPDIAGVFTGIPDAVEFLQQGSGRKRGSPVAVTGRLSSSNPNLQNIPIRSDLGRVIRAAFVPDEGCLFLSADYSQIELRIMAHLSGDEHMIEAFREGRDIHAATASKIYGVPLENVTSDMRRKAKTANFGIIYGISAFGLAERLDIPRTEAKMLIDGYFASYPRIKDFIDASIAKAQKLQYAETLLGRKRYLPDINSKNSVVRGFAERNAVNAPIQGTAADIIKQAMVRISERFKTEHVRSSMTMQVHDELNFSVIPEELELVKHIVVEEMENAMHLTVPLVADCGIGSNWLEAH